MKDKRTGIQRITDERARQISEESWTPKKGNNQMIGMETLKVFEFLERAIGYDRIFRMYYCRDVSKNWEVVSVENNEKEYRTFFAPFQGSGGLNLRHGGGLGWGSDDWMCKEILEFKETLDRGRMLVRISQRQICASLRIAPTACRNALRKLVAAKKIWISEFQSRTGTITYELETERGGEGNERQ